MVAITVVAIWDTVTAIAILMLTVQQGWFAVQIIAVLSETPAAGRAKIVTIRGTQWTTAATTLHVIAVHQQLSQALLAMVQLP